MAIQDYEGIHTGERVFLIGNGPSLSETPLDILADEYTIAMNNIDQIYDGTSWRPTYYLNVVKPPLSDDEVEYHLNTIELGIPSFISEDKRRYLPDSPNIEYVNRDQMDHRNLLNFVKDGEDLDQIWARDITEKVYRQHSSMYTAAQIAHYMGFEEMYFVGCDLYPEFEPFPYLVFETGSDPYEYTFNLEGDDNPNRGKVDFVLGDGKPLRSLINGISFELLRNRMLMKMIYGIYRTMGGTANTHFTDDYYYSRLYLIGTRNPQLIKIHTVIREIGKQLGFETYNATRGGRLEVHPRVDLEDLVND